MGYSSNLSLIQLIVLKYFNLKKPFKIVELDKNIGAGIISNSLYQKLLLETLEDITVYKKIEENKEFADKT